MDALKSRSGNGKVRLKKLKKIWQKGSNDRPNDEGTESWRTLLNGASVQSCPSIGNQPTNSSYLVESSWVRTVSNEETYHLESITFPSPLNINQISNWILVNYKSILEIKIKQSGSKLKSLVVINKWEINFWFLSHLVREKK